jgi:hypothetical protein
MVLKYDFARSDFFLLQLYFWFILPRKTLHDRAFLLEESVYPVRRRIAASTFYSPAAVLGSRVISVSSEFNLFFLVSQLSFFLALTTNSRLSLSYL